MGVGGLGQSVGLQPKSFDSFDCIRTGNGLALKGFCRGFIGVLKRFYQGSIKVLKVACEALVLALGVGTDGPAVPNV